MEVALTDIPEDVELFSVPRASILSATNTNLAEVLGKDVLGDEPWKALILVLIYEHLQGASSTWKPYLDILPKSFDTLMYWSEDELDELQGSAVRWKVGKLAADTMIRDQILPCIEEHQDVFYPPDTLKLTPLELGDLAHRMASIIMAYAFDLEPDSTEGVDEDGYATEDEDAILPKGMIPMADMLNADADHNVCQYFVLEVIFWLTVAGETLQRSRLSGHEIDSSD